MKLTLIRFGLGDDSTLGALYMDGVLECFTLEDERRAVKVKGETCIPEGTYDVVLRTEGGFHERYKKAHPDIHRGMLWIKNVPLFEWILFHQGRTDDHTAGCVLVGMAPAVVLTETGCEFEVSDSLTAYRRFYKKVVAAIGRGEKITLMVRTKAALVA